MLPHKTDTLVIGSGLAGAIAALTAAEQHQVILINKCPNLVSGNTAHAQGGIVFQGLNDSPEQLIDDILLAGDYHNNKQAVKKMANLGPDLISKLLIEKFNVPFNRDKKNSLSIISEAAHSIARIIHCGDHTGLSIHNAVITAIKKHTNITVLNNHTAIDLLTLSHHSPNSTDIYIKPTCFGAMVLNNQSDQIIPLYARKTILATGGLGQVYLHTTNPSEARGDGIAMAWRAGVRCINLQYIQFHPTALFHNSGRFLISEALRGEGAKLYDKDGIDFMKKIHPLGSLAPRDIVARGIHQTLLKTGNSCVYLDISFKSAKWIKDRFPNIYQHCLDKDIDITSSPIPVVPASHYSCGGVHVDLNGRTSLQGLYAIGEVACTGVHGANRLASTSLLECLVWGYIVGQSSDLLELEFPLIDSWEQGKQNIDPALILQDWLNIKNTMWNYVGLVRTRQRLLRAHDMLRRLQNEIEEFYQLARLNPEIIGLRNGIQTALAITNAAIEDRTSKGCHFISE